MNRAYSRLEIKATSDANGKRTFSGIATTPTPDRDGDIVEPDGAEFQLPIPLLWQHDSTKPIGWVRAARVTAAGIEVDCEIANVAEEGDLKDRLDEVWQSITAKLVGGLSIGFKPLESSRLGETWSYRFLKWLWLELSCVTIPANGDCSVTAIKSADRKQMAALGRKSESFVRIPPGVSGSPARKGVVYFNPKG